MDASLSSLLTGIVPGDPHNLLPAIALSYIVALTVATVIIVGGVNVGHAIMPTLFSNLALVAALTYYLRGEDHLRKLAITTLTIAFAVRMAAFLAARSTKKGTLPVKGKKKVKFFIMANVFLFHMVLCLPIIFTNSPWSKHGDIGPVDIIGASTALFGIVYEAIADQQKWAFRGNLENNGKWCDVGLYKYSRHPNYFGDVCFWFGVFFLSLAVLEGWQWVAVISPLVECYIIFIVDGIPKLKRHQDKTYGHNPSYWEYKNCTSAFFPCPPSLYTFLLPSEKGPKRQ